MANRRASVSLPLKLHDVSIALSKARSMASILEQLGDNDLKDAIHGWAHPEGTYGDLVDVVHKAPRSAIDEADVAYQKSLARGGASRVRRAPTPSTPPPTPPNVVALRRQLDGLGKEGT